MKRALALILMAGVCLTALPASAGGLAEMTDEELTAWMQAYNAQLAAAGADYAMEAIEFFTIGQGRPSNRIHQLGLRWVAGDARRLAGFFAGPNDITYHSDPDNVPSSIGSFPGAEIGSAMTTWDTNKCLKKVSVFANPTFGPLLSGTGFGDTTIFDEIFCLAGDSGTPMDGFPFISDIVHAGWYPAGCFAPTTLAFSVSFIFGTFTPSGFVPSDVNGDNYLDTALNEVYYNDAFSWMTGAAPLPDFDVETVAFHEAGHSLGIGHFGPPPAAVMNPIYAGPRQSPFPADKAGMCTLWASWPK